MTVTFKPRKHSGVGWARIAFGLAWAVDAAFKWVPAFQHRFISYLTSAEPGQPGLVRGWISGWVHVLKFCPGVFCHGLAIAETLLAIALITGALINLTTVVGAIVSFGIWSTAEGFGGPYMPGSTDIGASIIYVILFLTLRSARAGNVLGLDPVIRTRFPRLARLCSPPADATSIAEPRGGESVPERAGGIVPIG
ncbi:MAG: hypothetical protein J2O48_13505 [Solirubrobacterales bacterium]|nr:hypothetical protein [Solirubrobacterales bacterium]